MLRTTDKKNNTAEDKPWFLVQTKPKAEAVAFQNLENQEITAFMPLQKITLRKASKFQSVLRPLFPSYVFISLGLNSILWRKIKNTRGVTRIVRFGPSPSQVPSMIMSHLFSCCDSDGVFHTEKEHTIGNQVKITHGPMAGVTGSIINIDPQKRIQVLFDFMGQTSKITVASSWLGQIQ